MLESISPYALLRASKPKPVPSVVTAYDLFSAAQQTAALQSGAAPENPSPAEPVRMMANVPEPFVSGRRTHYISDIHTRHAAAFARSMPSTHPLT